jgi:hypothetical protein
VLVFGSSLSERRENKVVNGLKKIDIMKLIDLIFALVSRFTPMGPQQVRELRAEAAEWETKLNPETGNAIEKLYVKVNDPWFARLGFAISYIWLVKEIKTWLYEDEEGAENVLNV